MATQTSGAARANSLWARRVTWAAVVLGVGSVIVALAAALGAGQGMWHFRGAFGVLRYAFFVAIAGAVLGLVGLVMAQRARRGRLLLANLAALVAALGFLLFLGSLVRQARSVPAIHDVATDLDDLPQFTRLKVRADNLENVPDMDRTALKALSPEQRWKALHREAYGDLRTIKVSTSVEDTVRRAEALARERGWDVALSDPAGGTLEVTATSLFFRFKDDAIVRVRPAPGGGSLVDMRSISRVGGSDVGMNAKRVRAFLADLSAGT
ncbi:DUF1499 domain-containing protein [Sphingomonas parva]|uniref:DUF1499 domain-containing protein n=1 Tax=Sphingomonas parva TaxID=2555898 RepID=A0A4Y8ZV48_9SPHN|nr:DUF1499 domain-containing protein [Sphingomonas parva]TFI59005.1 DUF1499 domain-containing protein [Sphingomonas parva]